MEELNNLKDIISKSKYIVVMTGAGISVPSGIPDFRSEKGLYSNFEAISPEEMLSHTFFENHQNKFYEFYRSKMVYPDVLPNVAHYTLAKLEALGKVKAIITQNIDGLHQKAGSKNVIELHGSVLRNYCLKCKKEYNLNEILNKKEIIPKCSCGGVIKPDVVLYEEALPEEALTKAVEEVEKADCLIVVGTSLLVYPAAGLVHYFKGKHFIIINKSMTPFDHIAELVIHTPLEEVLTSKIITN